MFSQRSPTNEPNLSHLGWILDGLPPKGHHPMNHPMNPLSHSVNHFPNEQFTTSCTSCATSCATRCATSCASAAIGQLSRLPTPPAPPASFRVRLQRARPSRCAALDAALEVAQVAGGRGKANRSRCLQNIEIEDQSYIFVHKYTYIL